MHIKILRKISWGCATCLGKHECSSSSCNHLRLSPKFLTHQTIHNKYAAKQYLRKYDMHEMQNDTRHYDVKDIQNTIRKRHKTTYSKWLRQGQG